MCKESNEDDTKETLQTNKQKEGTHENSVGVLVSVHMPQVCVHVKHVVVLVVLLCIIHSVVVSVPRIHFSPVCEFLVIPCNCSLCENGSFDVLSLQGF